MSKTQQGFELQEYVEIVRGAFAALLIGPQRADPDRLEIAVKIIALSIYMEGLGYSVNAAIIYLFGGIASQIGWEKKVLGSHLPTQQNRWCELLHQAVALNIVMRKEWDDGELKSYGLIPDAVRNALQIREKLFNNIIRQPGMATIPQASVETVRLAVIRAFASSAMVVGDRIKGDESLPQAIRNAEFVVGLFNIPGTPNFPTAVLYTELSLLEVAVTWKSAETIYFPGKGEHGDGDAAYTALYPSFAGTPIAGGAKKFARAEGAQAHRAIARFLAQLPLDNGAHVIEASLRKMSPVYFSPDKLARQLEECADVVRLLRQHSARIPGADPVVDYFFYLLKRANLVRLWPGSGRDYTYLDAGAQK